MVDATTRFFEELDRRGYEPLLDKASGTLRFDVRDQTRTQHWLLIIDQGRLRVTREGRPADSVVGVSSTLFENVVSGRADGLAALLRGDMTVSGDARLVVQVERIFPGPPGAGGPRRVPREGAR